MSADPPAAPAASDPGLFHPDRVQKLEDLIAAGVDPYPEKSDDGERAWAADLVADADARAGETVRVHGRMLGRRGYGKLVFLDVHDQSGRVQACLQKDRLPEADFALTKAIHLGDIVSVRGEMGRTQKGEPTVFADSFQVLCKALAAPPEKWHGLADVEQRARMRYVDLFANEEVRRAFLKRSAIIQAMREVFLARAYVEVDTPVLHPVYGGAAARPFTTHHHALDMALYLRIAPELYLKRLLVGNVERVFEFARVFRNEGISPRHNPEFTMVEFYEAYSDVAGMMELTEELIVAAARAAGLGEDGKGLVARYRDEEFDLTPPFARVRYADAFREHAGCDPGDREAVRALLERDGIEPGAGEYGWWKAVNALFEEHVEPRLRGPVFVHDYPAAICPLAKPHRDDPTWAGRFEFFLGGMELANAFSELNDPRQQLRNFEEQVADKDPETPGEVDLDYVRALAHGMPPAGGCGIGVDRLVMVLLGVTSIREVLLFPHMRPEA